MAQCNGLLLLLLLARSVRHLLDFAPRRHFSEWSAIFLPILLFQLPPPLVGCMQSRAERGEGTEITIWRECPHNFGVAPFGGGGMKVWF